MAQQPPTDQPVTAAQLRSQLADRWQIPLLLLGMVVFVPSVLFLAIRLGQEKVDPNVLLQRARDAGQAGNFAACDTLCDEFLKQFSADPSVAEAAIAEALELRGDANFAMAALHPDKEMDLLDKARRSFNDAAEHRPSGAPSPRLLLKMGRTYAALGDFEKAIVHYDRALENEIENRLEIHRDKIHALRSMEPEPLLDEALAEVAQIHKELGEQATDDQRRDVALIEADLLNAKGRYGEAEAILRKVAGQNMPKVFLLALADTQRLAGRHTDAIDTLFELLDRVPADEAQRSAEETIDAQAFQMQGRISFDMKNYERALHWFQRTATEYPGTETALAAKLGTAQTYLVLDESALAAEVYAEITPELRQMRPGQNRWIDLEASRAALRVQSDNARKTGRIDDALKFVMLEESLLRDPDEDVLLRKAGILAERAGGLAAAAEALDAPPGAAEREGLRRQAERDWNEAGHLYLRVAEEFHGQTQKEYPNDLWEAGRCFILAGSHDRAVEALDRFVREQPTDTRVPQAQLEIARQYEVLGRLDEAVRVLQELRVASGDTLAGFEGLHRLGNIFVQMGPDFYDQAEEAYRGLVEDSTKVEPESLWYRSSLLQLGRLLHRRGDYDRAILALNEYMQRYPADPDAVSAACLIASSVRRQGLKALEKSQSAVRQADKDALLEIYRQKTGSAADQYRQLAKDYESLAPEAMTPLRQQEYCTVLFEQAECLIELGRLDEATALYNVVVYRFQMDPCVMAAYVRLAAAHEKAGHKDKARAVYERARWTLEKIPEEAFAMRIGEPSKQYWAHWIQTMQQN